MASEQAAQIGARLRERREELGLTRRQLSRRMEGLATENDLYRWESGLHKPQDDTLAAIATALDRDYAWAVGISPNGGPPQLSEVLGGEEPGAAQIADRLSQLEEQVRLLRVETAARDAEVLRRLDGALPPSRESRRPRLQ